MIARISALLSVKNFFSRPIASLIRSAAASTADVSMFGTAKSPDGIPGTPPPPAPAAPPEPPLSGADTMFNSSIPVAPRFFFAFSLAPASFCAFPAATPDALAAESMASDISSAPPPALPNSASVNARKTFARVISLPMMVLITLITGVSALINPWPIVALRDSNCSWRILT